MQTKLHTSLKLTAVVLAVSLPLPSTSLADKPDVLEDFLTMSTAAHHYEIYRELMCDNHTLHAEHDHAHFIP